MATFDSLTSGLDADEAARRVAAHIASRIRETLASQDRFRLVLTGGSSPAGIYARLAETELSWDRVEFYWSDERAVPPDDDESNYRLVHAHLLSKCDHDPSLVYRMPGEVRPVSAAAAQYEESLRRSLGDEPFDLSLLGMGEDGHVGSLFPGHATVDVTDRWVVAETDSPKPPPERLSLTIPRLSNSREIIVFTSGDERLAIIESILRDPESARKRWPIAHLALEHTRFVVAR